MRDIPIHGGVSHWYVDVQDPPSEFRMEIGYLAANGQFYCLARSNSVTTPPAGTSDSVDENWTDVADNADRIFAMSGGYSLARHEPRTARAARRTARPADGHADGNPLRRRRRPRAGQRARSCRSPSMPSCSSSA